MCSVVFGLFKGEKMLTYEKKIYCMDFNVKEEDNVIANGKIIVTQEYDYNFNEQDDLIEVEYFLNDSLPDVSKEDLEAYLNDKGINDLESSEIEISKEDLLNFVNL